MGIAKEYQEEIKEKLKQILLINSISTEQSMKLPTYSPRIDVAIPPFAFEERYIEKYRAILSENESFFNGLKEKALNGARLDFTKNLNPRCFLAVEIENSTGNDAKHILGSITNASILGKIGILVTMNSKNCLKRISKYLKFAKDVEKIDQEFANVILIQKKDFDEVLDEFLRNISKQ